MSSDVEILVAGQDAKDQVRAALGPSRSAIRFSGSASPTGQADQMLVAVSSELRSTAFREILEATPKAVPLVLLVDASMPATFGLEVVQLLARWAARRRREPFLATSPEEMRRLVLARKQDATKELIARATIEGDNLVIWSCEPKRYDVPVAAIPALASMAPEQLADFAVTSSGSRIHWNSADVDINLDTVRTHADPAARHAHEKKSRAEASRYAKAIRGLREEKGLEQTQISGLSCDRQVRRIESGECVPQIESLRLPATAHGMATNDYLAELARLSSHSRRKSTRK
ncbi:MAG: DUF2442 domain-containing protein [Deltaproteobacteria bacterium]|nr:DUF2442 domain-containing protein [Deltaproteobacteria bacterium]